MILGADGPNVGVAQGCLKRCERRAKLSAGRGVRGGGVGGSRWYWRGPSVHGGEGLGREKSESESEEQGEKKDFSSDVEGWFCCNGSGGGDCLRRWRGDVPGVGGRRGYRCGL